MRVSKILTRAAAATAAGVAVLAFAAPAGAATATAEEIPAPVAEETEPEQLPDDEFPPVMPRSAYGTKALGGFSYSAGGLTIKVPSGCFLTHGITGKGLKIDSQRAGVDCAGPAALAAKFCNSRIEFHYADTNNKTYRIDKGPLVSSCKTGTVPMVSKGAKTVKAGKACAQLWINGTRKAVQCHYITK
ncbi:hypothetical protein [Streptomyces cavourensis]|uniref:hypothetical protein n=1 Tax=Streptomyces cavourensis TaxID=67258 RepID=UPI0020C9D04C|nr:hypothetical protein [Streptomyces cavourensis]